MKKQSIVYINIYIPLERVVGYEIYNASIDAPSPIHDTIFAKSFAKKKYIYIFIFYIIFYIYNIKM